MIGTPSVFLYPDPANPVFGAPIASNPGMTDDIAGWKQGVNSNPWTWAGGQAMAPAVIAGSAGLFRDSAFPVVRDPTATAYRVRARTTVTGACWVIPGMYFGTTASAAHDGPFWQPANALDRGTWVYVPGAGTFTVEAQINPADIPAGFGYVGPYCNYFPVSGVASQPVSIDSLELTQRALVNVDVTCLLDQAAIRHGRGSPDGQPEASTVTMDLSLDTGEAAIPDALEIGAGVGIFVTTPLIASQRFYGRITDIQYGWEDRGEDTPDALVAQVNAAGILSDLGRRVVGDTPWPAELDGARVSRILTAAGLNADPAFSDPGTVQILGRDVDAQAALPLAQSVAEDAMGVVWETKEGTVLYADSEHRRGAQAVLTLDACDVLVTPAWTRDTGGLVNLVSIGYGVAPSGSEQPRYTTSAPTSQTRYGRYEYTRATQLADLAAATTLGSVLLARNASPVWVFSELPVDMAGLDAQRTAALLGLDVHALVELVGLPVAGNAPTSDSLWIEGWTENLAAGVHELSLVVSGFCRTSPPPRWDDMPPVTTWANVPAGLTWDGAVCVGPAPHPGNRWMDIPASTRWNQLTPAQTWDTFTGDTVAAVAAA